MNKDFEIEEYVQTVRKATRMASERGSSVYIVGSAYGLIATATPPAFYLERVDPVTPNSFTAQETA